ncbi:tumor necrosis factor receptor superfamily member 11B-like [Myxocyprinus asiaticus]|uniref:tumor necrosis factor receptor superfamily member 11B-like n=1 Tax=Myxocyprinus asiaticus TaxID=70543 RepID=UPI002222F971|nr:tumor necrosis factor receptor superfamily member 11B-like [Myxocyprinus asiaticus]
MKSEQQSARGMFLFTVLLLPVLSVSGSDRVYQRVDPVTGQTLVCDRCPPGFRLSAHCTRSRQTECVPCGADLYTEFWNFIPYCLLCDACTDNQRLVRACNGTVNALCECEVGFYWNQYFCKRHTVCKPGHGVKSSGTPHTDTVCELCSDGQFADITQTHAECVAHSTCGSDEQLVLRGSRWHDNVCATCDQITVKGWVDLFRPILWSLFVQQKIPAQRLQRFVNLLLQMNSQWREMFQNTESPMELIQRWISQVSEEELQNLLPKLKATHLGHFADKIKHKIRKFEMFDISCSNSKIMNANSFNQSLNMIN